jgi:hypothetical protein
VNEPQGSSSSSSSSSRQLDANGRGASERERERERERQKEMMEQCVGWDEVSMETRGESNHHLLTGSYAKTKAHAYSIAVNFHTSKKYLESSS